MLKSIYSQMNADEISLVNPTAQAPANSAFFVRSDSEVCYHYDISNVGEIFGQINSTHVNALKTALKSVYPFVPSISNSEYYFIHPALVPLGCTALGVFALTTKTFSNKLLQDYPYVAALAYEIEFYLTHRSGFQILDEFSPLSTVATPGLQTLGVQNVQQVETAQIRVSGSSTDVMTAKDMLYAYFQNGFQGQLFSVQQTLPLAGAWWYAFKIRGHLIAQGSLYSTLGFNLLSLAKLNVGLRITPAQLSQRIQGNSLRIEALYGGVSVALNMFDFSGDLDLSTAGALGNQQDNLQLSDKPTDKAENSGGEPGRRGDEKNTGAEEFSFDDMQPYAVRYNFLTKLFTKQEMPDDAFVLQANRSNLCRINPAFKHSRRTTQQPAIVCYTNENIRERKLTMLGVQFSGGESVVAIGSAFEAHVGSKYGSESVKLVVCRYICDIYIGSEFASSCPTAEVTIRLLEKGSCAEAIEVDM